MKKRLLFFSMSILLLSACVGCSSQTLTEYEQQNAQAQTGAQGEASGETEVIEEEKEPEMVSVDIFYSNADATGFDKKEVEIEALTADALIKELAKVNAVSYDTEVLSFSQSGNSLTLDLSSEFSNYINMMGTAGEYIVTGSLANTFLTAYQAKDILITVKGKTLETSHAIYDKPLTMFEMGGNVANDDTDEAKTPMSYRLKDTSFTQEEKQIYYPQFDGMPDEDIQESFNQLILDVVTNNTGAKDNTVYEAYSVDYKIGYCATDKISFIFTKKTTVDGQKQEAVFALSFDMVEGTCIRFKDLSDALETVSYNMANQGYYKVIGDGIDREAYDEFYKADAIDAEGYREKFLHFDYDSEDLSVVPEGYIFINADGELELILPPVEGLCDKNIKIQTGVQLK